MAKPCTVRQQQGVTCFLALYSSTATPGRSASCPETWMERLVCPGGSHVLRVQAMVGWWTRPFTLHRTLPVRGTWNNPGSCFGPPLLMAPVAPGVALPPQILSLPSTWAGDREVHAESHRSLGFVLQWELTPAPEQPATVLWSWQSSFLRISPHTVSSSGRISPQSYQQIGEIPVLLPLCLLKWQPPSGPFEQTPPSPAEPGSSAPGKNLFLGAWEPSVPQALRPSGLSPCPAASLQARHNQEPGRGVGLDRQAWGGSYYLCGTMGMVSHEFKAGILTEIRQPDLYSVPKSK